MGKGKDKKGFYQVAGSARSEAAKALIVPFDILYSIIATGAMLNGKDFSRENQSATLTCLGLIYAVTSVETNNEANNGANNGVNNGAIIPTTCINGPCKRIIIEGGTTWSNNQRTICGTKITITGGKQGNKRGGTRIIEEGNITTQGGELIFNNGKVSNKEGRFFNIGGEEILYQEPNEDNEEPTDEE
ncbi:PREDICTED: uncharacterized protein LOC109583471 [Amphimedon queenslandica]|uniref:Uncharacterized protein n=1 Tax=Amphimedon queenslandica TaxID=400682 RepID=A0AAN0JCB0_AMPQE|nr:PREDICTED: uncharacterized protein LOC109583471 [Amphimedon queenslandica]|eukprot:XP_019854407.1 PREDICTED: uncharacterized protein LOC109583471 [Amphimedon queenslandica]